MRKENAIDFWQTYLPEALNGNTEPAINPAVKFSREAKLGEYDHLPDEEYELLLNDVEETSKFFRDKPKCNPITVFNRALRLTPFTAEEQAELIRILATASMRVDYAKLSSERITGISDDLKAYSPADLYLYLSANIYGQERAKKSASMLVYNHLQGRRRNAIFSGPTGCGKSEIWRTLSKKIPCIKVFDATALSADGWKGSLHWRGIFESVPKELREWMIIVLDEFDKSAEPVFGGNGNTDYSKLIQNTLLRIMDGDTVTFEGDDKRDGFSVDCSNVSIVMLGTFETLLAQKSRADRSELGFNSAGIRRKDYDYSNTVITLDDLIRYGNLRREVAGRVQSITQLHPMAEGDFLALLNTPETSPVDRLSDEYNIPITVSDVLKHQLCRKASESKLGVRFIRSQIQQRVDDLLYEDCTRAECHLDVSPTEETRGPAMAS